MLRNISTTREVNSNEIDSNFTARETQNKGAFTTPSHKQPVNSHNCKHPIEFTYSDFPCHFTLNRDKIALINHGWKCKTGKRLTITANF